MAGVNTGRATKRGGKKQRTAANRWRLTRILIETADGPPRARNEPPGIDALSLKMSSRHSWTTATAAGWSAMSMSY